jgi:hypothetical protein
MSIQAAQGDIPAINRRTTLASLLLAAKKANETPLEPLGFLQASDEAATSELENQPQKSPRNPAVARCIAAHNKALEAAKERKLGAYDAHKTAQHAYREAFPPLIGRKNIREFIACVGYAMLTEVVTSSEGARLLYAARVASQVHDNRSHRARQKSVQNAPQSAPFPGKSAPLSPENGG